MSVRLHQTAANLLFRIWDLQTNTQNATQKIVTVFLRKLATLIVQARINPTESNALTCEV